MQNSTRNKNITFRVTDEEYAAIQRKMKLTKIQNMRHFLLKMALEGRVIYVELDSVKEMVRLLGNASNNINQIAHRVNITDNINAADIDEIKARQDEIWEQTRKILQRLNAMNF
ncbi:MAG: MobC family plasmid mobilization relaxosome protein [Clostridiales bacterium]|nr:MobC family plasmid mobilization relaxosome protein [Clostridiales bacterium]